MIAESHSRALAACERLLQLIEQLDDFYELLSAIDCCRSPQTALGGMRPLDLIVSEEGSAEVFAVLARLRDSVYV